MARTKITDVAAKAGVSVATVSYVLNHVENQTISEETRAKVEEVARELHYVSNRAASSLKNGRSNLIGVVIPQAEPGKEILLSDPLYGELLSGMEYKARRMGYHMLLSGLGDDQDYSGVVRNRLLDGVIIVGAYPAEHISDLAELHAPVVLVDADISDTRFHELTVDDRAGGKLATEYLIDHGHMKIAYVGETAEQGSAADKRYAGYADALAAHGLSPERNRVYHGQNSYAFGERVAEAVLAHADGTTAVFAASDILAIGLMHGFALHGVRVPEDMSIIGFDDLPISRMVSPALTTIHQDIAAKGEKAVDMVLDAMVTPEKRQSETLPVRLVERDTVRRI